MIINKTKYSSSPVPKEKAEHASAPMNFHKNRPGSAVFSVSNTQLNFLLVQFFFLLQ